MEAIKENADYINSLWSKAENKMRKAAPKMKGKIPYSARDGKYDNVYPNEPDWWTNGFWGGLMWIFYDRTKDKLFFDAATDCEKLLNKAFNERYESLHHDVGFMWDLTSGNNYRICENADSKVRLLECANLLMGRFNLTGGYIRAWNNPEYKTHTIIDTMMNLPLLYRASEIIGDERYSLVAKSHADMALRDHLRPDGAVVHIVEHSELTGECVGYIPGQGYASDSVWSRGQAWAAYGFAISYLFTKQEKYLTAAKRAAQYFIANVAETDWLPLCDFRAPKEPVLFDSTAGACAACGLIEIGKLVGEYEKEFYNAAAINIIKAMDKHFCNWKENEDSILQMGSHSYHKLSERHIHIIYGDFFLAEALYKLTGGNRLFW